MRRPRLLDLFCGPGGAAVGYHRAGFDVIGVDIETQPDYPYEFHQGDALAFLDEHGHQFDAVHASPPCTEHTTLTGRRPDQGTGHLLEDTLRALETRQDGAWVVENVMGADMPTDMVLCGTMFGLRVYRHRRFRIGPALPMLQIPEHHPHRVRAARKQRMRAWEVGLFLTVTGDAAKKSKRERPIMAAAMGIEHIGRQGVNLTIPPAYTHHIGEQLIDALGVAA